MSASNGVNNGAPARLTSSPSRESSVGPAGSDTSESSVDSPSQHRPKKLIRIRSRAGEMTFGKLLTSPLVSSIILFCFVLVIHPALALSHTSWQHLNNLLILYYHVASFFFLFGRVLPCISCTYFICMIQAQLYRGKT